MANPSVNTVRSRGLRGITPFLASGRGTGDFGALASDGTAFMDIADSEVVPGMTVFAQVQVAPDPDIIITSAVAGSKKVTINVRNSGVAALVTGNCTIAYFCTPGTA